MSKTFKSFALFAALAALAGGAMAQSSGLVNSGHVYSSTQVFASVNGAGTSLSNAVSSTGSTANGAFASHAGNVALSGDVAGYSNLSAYNVATGSGTGTAGGRALSDSGLNGAVYGSIPTGSINITGAVDGGMGDRFRNGSDVTVQATTAQDGFVQSLYNGGFAATGLLTASTTHHTAGVQGNVQGTSYEHSEIAAGGVTFTGGTPAGQSAAVRFGQVGVEVNFSGNFIDPTH